MHALTRTRTHDTTGETGARARLRLTEEPRFTWVGGIGWRGGPRTRSTPNQGRVRLLVQEAELPAPLPLQLPAGLPPQGIYFHFRILLSRHSKLFKPLLFADVFSEGECPYLLRIYLWHLFVRLARDSGRSQNPLNLVVYHPERKSAFICVLRTNLPITWTCGSCSNSH